MCHLSLTNLFFLDMLPIFWCFRMGNGELFLCLFRGRRSWASQVRTTHAGGCPRCVRFYTTPFPDDSIIQNASFVPLTLERKDGNVQGRTDRLLFVTCLIGLTRLGEKKKFYFAVRQYYAFGKLLVRFSNVCKWAPCSSRVPTFFFFFFGPRVMLFRL
jgi:hypothetical protein